MDKKKKEKRSIHHWSFFSNKTTRLISKFIDKLRFNFDMGGPRLEDDDDEFSIQNKPT